MDPQPEAERSADMSRRTKATTGSDELRAAHEALIFQYVRLLKEVSSLPLIGGAAATMKSRVGWIVWRGLVRLFVEAHVRRQLQTLRNLYVLQQSIILSSLNHKDTLFEEGQESVEKLLEAISSWHRLKLILATTSPVVVGLLVAKVGVDNVYDAVVNVATSRGFKTSAGTFLVNYSLLAYFLLALAYLLFPVLGSFNYKRHMFFPTPASELPEWLQRRRARPRAKRRERPLRQGPNVYEIENDLFNMLEARKSQEPRLDS
jgi:hypothetical protein